MSITAKELQGIIDIAGGPPLSEEGHERVLQILNRYGCEHTGDPVKPPAVPAPRPAGG